MQNAIKWRLQLQLSSSMGTLQHNNVSSYNTDKWKPIIKPNTDRTLVTQQHDFINHNLTLKYVKWKHRLKVNLAKGKLRVFCPNSLFSYWRRALARDRCSTYLAESVPAPRAVPESLYIALELCWGQVIRQLVKHTTNDSSWQQTFHRAWKGARMTRLTQHLENTPIKKNDYRKTK